MQPIRKDLPSFPHSLSELAAENFNAHYRAVRPAALVPASRGPANHGRRAEKAHYNSLRREVLSWLRKTAQGKGLSYQSLVCEILANEMRKIS